MALVSNKTAIPYVQKAPTSIGNSPYNGLTNKYGLVRDFGNTNASKVSLKKYHKADPELKYISARPEMIVIKLLI